MDLPQLIHLEINSNEIKKIDGFENCQKIKYLDLSSNSISDMSTISI